MDLEPKLTAAQLAEFIALAEEIVNYKSGQGGFHNTVSYAAQTLDKIGFVVPFDGLWYYSSYLKFHLGSPGIISDMDLDSLRKTVIALFQAEANEQGVIYTVRKAGYLSKLIERAKQLQQAL